MSEFGGLIRDARERLGLSPHRVAELIGRASGTVKAWERGRTVPNDPFVVTSLAAVLAIDEPTLFRAAGLTPPTVAPANTIEQDLASIAPAKTPAHAPPQPRPAAEAESERGAVITDEHPAVTTESGSIGAGEAPAAESPLDAIGAFLDKGVEVLEKGREAIVEAGVPAIERLRRRRRQPKARPDPRPVVIPSVQPVSESYMDDPDERWAYRLRTIWTAAGVGALGLLLLWAGSRALDAFGDTWDALLAGL